MLVVALFKVKAGTPEERMARRLQWQYPPQGVKKIAEYWLQTTDPAVIAVAEADSVAQMMASTAGWHDVFDITIVPAVTAEEGLEIARRMQA